MILDKELCKCKYLCNVILLVGFWECPTPGSLSINSSSRILVWIALKMVFITLGPASEYKFMFLLDLEIIIFASNLLRRAHLIQYSYSAIILLGNIVELKSKYEEL